MGILDKLEKTIKNYSSGDIEQALMNILIAADATAKKEYPTINGNAERYKKFLEENRFLIQVVSINVRMTNPISFRNMHNDQKLANRPTLTLAEIIYHIVRCNLLHEAEIPVTIAFTDEAAIKLEADKMVLPKNLILALLVAVITSSCNNSLRFSNNFDLNIFGKVLPLNIIWGDKNKALQLLG